jgi:hypothetical protein
MQVLLFANFIEASIASTPDPTLILQDFINDFPESEYLDETYSYLVNAFLTHKDYSRAIKSMEANGLENIRLQQAYQEVSYYRAVQLFNDGEYVNSINHFDKSLRCCVFVLFH